MPLKTKADKVINDFSNTLRDAMRVENGDDKLRYSIIDILMLVGNPHDFDDVIDIVANRLHQGLHNKETIVDTLNVINYLLGTHYVITDFVNSTEAHKS